MEIAMSSILLPRLDVTRNLRHVKLSVFVVGNVELTSRINILGVIQNSREVLSFSEDR